MSILQMFEQNFALIALMLFVLFLFVTIMFLVNLYKRCPSNKVLVVYGKVGGSKFAKCYHGGGTFIWPLIQSYEYLDLIPMTIHIPLKGALSNKNIRINVPSTFTIAVDTTQEAMNNAAIRLLGLSRGDIELMATEIITGQLRLTVASLSIEEINQDRERFLQEIRHNIDHELLKIGLALINVNITDITDESHYIESIGKKASTAAINQAKIDVAEQEKLGDIGRALAEQERRVQVAIYNAEAIRGESESKAKVALFDAQAINQAKIHIAEQEKLGEIGLATAEQERRITIARLNAEAIQGENEAQGNIALFNAKLLEQQAEADRRSKVAQQESYAQVSQAQAIAEKKRLEVEIVVPKEIEKRNIEIAAAAQGEKQRLEAQGQASAILAIKEAEAAGIKKVLEAKAEGYRLLVKACGDNAQDAASMLMIEKLEEIAKLQAEAIKNIKIDKITVWDSGSGKDGSSTSNFMSNMIKSLPPLHEVAAMSGIKLPEYLGQVSGVDAQAHKVTDKHHGQTKNN